MRYAAEQHNLADGHDEVLAEVAGVTARLWYASPATHVGYELIGTGKALDYGEPERWSRAGYERRMRFRKGER
jgi:hypothetical protein